ncbi:MAG: NusG domain II-containing protein [Treponema sp.]|jgi:hypothetical protein|nr:NusG domain II-containing protein [Treponema sp.]
MKPESNTLREQPYPVEPSVRVPPFPHKRVFGLVDCGILIAAFCAAAASFIFAYSGTGTQYTIKVKGESGGWIFPRDAAETVTVAGPLGETIVEIKNGTARILSSPCTNQTCVAAGIIHSPGQWTACLPNRVMAFIDEETPAPDRGAAGNDNGTDVDAAAW